MGKENTQHICVALADDHELLRESVVPRIEDDGDIRIIIKAANGKELITTIRQHSTLPHVCLVDIMMPEMNGFETVSYIKKNWPEIKILVLTSYIQEAYVIQMIYAGVNGYLSKNSHPSVVKEAIRQVVEFDLYCNELLSMRNIKAIREGRMTLPSLTAKEIELLRYCIEDLTYLEIAQRMKTSAKSIEGYRNKLFQKLGTKTRTGLAMFAVRYGYVPVDTGILPRFF
jgi:two-component system, NarL family, invasion response regulator UvrY